MRQALGVSIRLENYTHTRFKGIASDSGTSLGALSPEFAVEPFGQVCYNSG